MKHNMGSADRVVRAAVVAVALVIVAFIVGASSIVGIVLFAVAAGMLGTAAVGFCAPYTLFGFNTCRHTTPAPR